MPRFRHREADLRFHRLSNIALVITFLGLSYLVLELVVFPIALRHMPLNQHEYLGRLDVLAQSSKSGTFPSNYIALVGDSFAQGRGDWLQDSDPDSNGPFHSAHVLHQLSGRDVVSFGRGNAGSLEGLANEPQARYHAIDDSPWYALDPPSLIIAYVYEGNDFDNNIRTLRKANLISVGAAETVDAAVLERFVAESSANSRRRAAMVSLPVLAYGLKAAIGIFKSEKKKKRRKSDTKNGPAWRDQFERKPNIARVAGQHVRLPSSLQAPAMELTRPELDTAVLLYRISLAALGKAFPDAELIVVYLPSPLTTYRLVSETVSIQSYQKRRRNVQAADVARRSNELCRLVLGPATAVGARFFDARPALRAAAERRIIHGPKDWKHFNREGYTALGEAIYGFLQFDGAYGPGCASL